MSTQTGNDQPTESGIAPSTYRTAENVQGETRLGETMVFLGSARVVSTKRTEGVISLRYVPRPPVVSGSDTSRD